MKMHHIVVFVRRSEDFFAGMIYNTYTYIHTYFAGTPPQKNICLTTLLMMVLEIICPACFVVKKKCPKGKVNGECNIN